MNRSLPVVSTCLLYRIHHGQHNVTSITIFILLSFHVMNLNPTFAAVWTGYAFRQPFDPTTILVDLPLAESLSTQRQLDLYFQGTVAGFWKAWKCFQIRRDAAWHCVLSHDFHDFCGLEHDFIQTLFIWKLWFCWFFSHQTSWIWWSTVSGSSNSTQIPIDDASVVLYFQSSWENLSLQPWVKIRYWTTCQNLCLISILGKTKLKLMFCIPKDGCTPLPLHSRIGWQRQKKTTFFSGLVFFFGGAEVTLMRWDLLRRVFSRNFVARWGVLILKSPEVT